MQHIYKHESIRTSCAFCNENLHQTIGSKDHCGSDEAMASLLIGSGLSARLIKVPMRQKGADAEGVVICIGCFNAFAKTITAFKKERSGKN